jgi:hypothetical protein
MTLGCGAMAGNSTSDNVGPLHLINIKRLAYTVRTPEQAFEMPLDYDKAPDIPVPAAGGGGPIDRSAVISPRAASPWRRRWQAPRPRLHPVDAPRRLPHNLPFSSPWWLVSPPKWSTAFWRAAAPHRPVPRNPAAIADCQTPAQKRLHRRMLRLPNRWSSFARRTSVGPSKRTVRSISGRKQSLHLRPATWPIPLIFWSWLRAEEATWT